LEVGFWDLGGLSGGLVISEKGLSLTKRKVNWMDWIFRELILCLDK
jgi:hypothetical protein